MRVPPAGASPGSQAPVWAIGLDVGGTKIAGGLVEVETGALLSRRLAPTRTERGGEAVLSDVLAMAEALKRDATGRGGSVAGIGLGVPELVTPDGTIRSSHRLDWEHRPVRERVSEIAPAVVGADVRLAALAEGRFGAGRASRVFAYVTVGTGISSCLVQDGKPFAGARGGALVLASGPLTVTCDACGARSRVVVEDVASGPALVARYRARSGRPAARAEDVLTAAATGDEAALAVVQAAGDALGCVVGFLINVLDPEAVIVGGGLGLAGGRYWDAFVVATRAHVWSAVTRELPILPAALGVDAGLIGAAVAAVAAERA